MTAHAESFSKSVNFADFTFIDGQSSELKIDTMRELCQNGELEPFGGTTFLATIENNSNVSVKIRKVRYLLKGLPGAKSIKSKFFAPSYSYIAPASSGTFYFDLALNTDQGKLLNVVGSPVTQLSGFYELRILAHFINSKKQRIRRKIKLGIYIGNIDRCSS